MLTLLIWFGIGVIVGAIAMFFIFANNNTLLSKYAAKASAKIDKVVSDVKEQVDELKDKQ